MSVVSTDYHLQTLALNQLCEGQKRWYVTRSANGSIRNKINLEKYTREQTEKNGYKILGYADDLVILSKAIISVFTNKTKLDGLGPLKLRGEEIQLSRRHSNLSITRFLKSGDKTASCGQTFTTRTTIVSHMMVVYINLPLRMQTIYLHTTL